MILSSRPKSPFALWLATDPGPFQFNGRDVANGGFTGDVGPLWDTVRQAFKWWDIDVVAGGKPPTKPSVGIALAPAFGYPGGGAANVGSWQTGGIQACVFTDVNQFNPFFCGLEAVHESGHVAGGFADMMTNGIYTPGFFMGMPLPDGIEGPRWTRDQKLVLDTRFGNAPDLNFDGKTTIADAMELVNADATTPEIVTVGKAIREGGR